ncbi:MAG TPA: oligopeptide transporter, OPT family, partial [Planctomycetia bacterium]|nr:oligopeptide transporter, OPT family [Planctomycetia bacterium]
MADTDRTAPLPEPVIPPHQSPPELTLQAVIAGALLGIVFGASSLYLVLKVGLTVSASIPVSVLSITLFRLLTKTFRVRNTTILENNIVQTAGSAGESIAFGLGVTVPAVLALGFELEIVRAMVVGVLGGLLGILMMIPLRRAFIVAQHHELPYPEGTAAAEVLKVGEKGGSGAKYVFGGFGLGFLYKALSNPLNLLKGEVEQPLYNKDTGAGLQKGYLAAEISPELLGVGYIIGPRVASIMLSGGLLAYLVLVPLIARLGGESAAPIAPGKTPIASMGLGEIRTSYILYIGAGAVATGGIISMLQALPIIFGSIAAGIRDVRSATGAVAKKIRTERDLPGWFVLLGTIGLVAALTLVPNVGLGLSIEGLCGAGMVVVFGFLFVTVSSRITG